MLVKINPSRSTKEMITAGGFARVSSNITDRYLRVVGASIKEIEVILRRYEGRKTTSEVLDEMKKEGLRPITFEELLFLAVNEKDMAANGEIRRLVCDEFYCIMALGEVSIWPSLDDGRYSPCLSPYDRKWQLSEYTIEGIWVTSDSFKPCFATVRM